MQSVIVTPFKGDTVKVVPGGLVEVKGWAWSGGGRYVMTLSDDCHRGAPAAVAAVTCTQYHALNTRFRGYVHSIPCSGNTGVGDHDDVTCMPVTDDVTCMPVPRTGRNPSVTWTLNLAVWLCRGIVRVDVTNDGGKTWQVAELGQGHEQKMNRA